MYDQAGTYSRNSVQKIAVDRYGDDRRVSEIERSASEKYTASDVVMPPIFFCSC